MLQKNDLCFCGGPLFVGAPVRPNMLIMPKSAPDIYIAERRHDGTVWRS